MKQIISLNGNIGAGKSTIMDRLRDMRDENGGKVFEWIPEPIEEWTPWLNIFYGDKARYSYSFQLKVLLHQMERYEYIQGCWERGEIVDNVLFERDPIVAHHVFAQSLYEEGHIHDLEMSVYREFYDRKFHWVPGHAIYLRATPEKCMERMVERARGSELGGVTLDYLNALHEKHERLFISPGGHYGKVTVVDANQGREEVFHDICTALGVTVDGKQIA